MDVFSKRKVGLLSCGFRCVWYLYKLEPIKIICYTIINIIYALAWVLQVFVLQTYFDWVMDANNSFHKLIFCLIAVGFVYFFYHLMDGLSNCYPETISLRINEKLNLLIFKKLSLIEPIQFESAEHLDKINKARKGSNCLVWVGFVLIDIVSYYITYFLFMGGYMFQLDPTLVLSIIVVFIPVIISKMVDIWIFNNLEDKAAPERRKMEYYEKCLTDREYFKETRFLGANSFFSKLLYDSMKKHKDLVLKAQLKKNIINCLINIITTMGYGVIILMLFDRVMKRNISIGAFVAILTSINNMFRFMNKMIIDRIGWATENVGAVYNYFVFLDESKEKEIKNSCDTSFIELRNVDFQYPNTEKKALKGINLRIDRNQKIALVGENGSGKTTLCRIILGLYTPTEGKISYSNELTKNEENYRMSAVFQKFNRYKLLLKENVIIGQPEKAIEDEQLKELCTECGVLVKSNEYPEGIETLLGNEFGGTDVSGGQWQRIAIARGIYCDSKIIVMDEPTSSIDPMVESEIYKEFERIGKNKSIILVTHRLGSVHLADKIIVLKEGMIVQEGTHEELISKEGEYKRFYFSQKKWYN